MIKFLFHGLTLILLFFIFQIDQTEYSYLKKGFVIYTIELFLMITKTKNYIRATEMIYSTTNLQRTNSDYSKNSKFKKKIFVIYTIEFHLRASNVRKCVLNTN